MARVRGRHWSLTQAGRPSHRRLPIWGGLDSFANGLPWRRRQLIQHRGRPLLEWAAVIGCVVWAAADVNMHANCHQSGLTYKAGDSVAVG